MSVSKDLTVTVTNEAEGVTVSFKTVSSLGTNKVFIAGDAAVHDIKEIEQAIQTIKEFSAKQDQDKAQAEIEAQGITEVHT
jgi:hypothetical protein